MPDEYSHSLRWNYLLIISYFKAIIVDHTLPDIYVNLGLICIRQKKYSEWVLEVRTLNTDRTNVAK